MGGEGALLSLFAVSVPHAHPFIVLLFLRVHPSSSSSSCRTPPTHAQEAEARRVNGTLLPSYLTVDQVFGNSFLEEEYITAAGNVK